MGSETWKYLGCDHKRNFGKACAPISRQNINRCYSAAIFWEISRQNKQSISFNKSSTRTTNSAFLPPYFCPLHSSQHFNSSTLHSARFFVSLAPGTSFSVRIISGCMRGSTTFSAIFSNKPRGLSTNTNLTNYTHKLWRIQNEVLLSVILK